MTEIVCRLKHVLLDKGINQSELAVKIGVRRETISNIANERTDPSITTALIIAEALGVSVHDIWQIKKD